MRDSPAGSNFQPGIIAYSAPPCVRSDSSSSQSLSPSSNDPDRNAAPLAVRLHLHFRNPDGSLTFSAWFTLVTASLAGSLWVGVANWRPRPRTQDVRGSRGGAFES